MSPTLIKTVPVVIETDEAAERAAIEAYEAEQKQASEGRGHE